MQMFFINSTDSELLHYVQLWPSALDDYPMEDSPLNRKICLQYIIHIGQ